MRIEVVPDTLANTVGPMRKVQGRAQALRGTLGQATSGVGAATGHAPAEDAFGDLRSVWLQSVGQHSDEVGALATSVSVAVSMYRFVDSTAWGGE